MSNKESKKTVKSRLLGEEYTLIKHESGLTVCVFPKKMSVTYAIITTKFGSLDSRFRTGDGVIHQVPDGVAHFLEHKMFENPDGEDTFEKFSRTGADANAFTSLRDTSYVFSCTENVGESLRILLGSVFTPYFTEENVKKEQGIIAQEINMGDDDPGSVLFLDLMNCLYSKNGIKTDVAGTVESIMKITPDILYECYRAFYLPGNMMLCVCGDVSADEVAAAVSEAVPSGLPHPAVSLYPDEPERTVKKHSERKMAVSKPLFSIGIKDTDISTLPDERMKKSAAMRLLVSVCFGKSGDFYGELLSDHRREAMNYYYNDDMSLAEIAEVLGITRQGVRDLIKKAGDELTFYEEKLGLARRFREVEAYADEARALIGKGEDERLAAAIEKIIGTVS